jgi:hypothetical protein
MWQASNARFYYHLKALSDLSAIARLFWRVGTNLQGNGNSTKDGLPKIL